MQAPTLVYSFSPLSFLSRRCRPTESLALHFQAFRRVVQTHVFGRGKGSGIYLKGRLLWSDGVVSSSSLSIMRFATVHGLKSTFLSSEPISWFLVFFYTLVLRDL